MFTSGDGFQKEPTGEEIDQSNLGPEAASQEQIGLDQFGAGQFSQNELLAGMNQLQQPDMNQLLSQQQATLQVLGNGRKLSVSLMNFIIIDYSFN